MKNINKRIIGVIVIKNDRVVNSFQYKKYLPIGKVSSSVLNLDMWEVDEILILDINRSKKQLGPNFELIENLNKKNFNTPLIYAGSIRNYKDAIKLCSLGIERIVIDNFLFNNPEKIKKISEFIGSQAIILCLPLKYKNKELFYFNHVKKKEYKINEHPITLFDKNMYSEILIIDYKNEGDGLFDLNLLKISKIIEKKLIVFGGINNIKLSKKILKNKFVSAIGVGNKLNFKESSIYNLKEQIKHNFKNKNIIR